MSVNSMTGFARVESQIGSARWVWEIKTVNSKGLDLRFRLPFGMDALESALRARVVKKLARGACQINLSVKRDAKPPEVRVNRQLLDTIVQAIAEAGRTLDTAPPRLDSLFAIKGVLEVEEQVDDEALPAFHVALLNSFDEALNACARMRRNEGEAIAHVLSARIAAIEELTQQAEDNPARQPAAIAKRLEAQITALLECAPTLDSDRLYQEAVLLAAKVDIREELDRLQAHVAAARTLLQSGDAVGRRLDFLAQEFNREANTLCAKSNDINLTATGLSLKAVIEQFREQVQNIE